MDATNNVEAIQVQAPSPGSWKVEVVGANVPESTQDFALVVIGALGGTKENNLVRMESTPNMVIPDNDSEGISDVLNLDQEGIASSVAVEVNIRHPYIGDLLLVLTAPNAIQVTLHERQGAGSQGISKRFDVHNTPELHSLAGADIAGEWRLGVSDHARIDEGVLLNWALEIITESKEWVEAESKPALLIPDNDTAGISDSIEIMDSGAVKELEVSVDITHTWIGDLRVLLTNPSGVSVALHGRTGGDRDNLITVFDYKSLPRLDAFTGAPGAGTWTLTVSDNEGRDTGKLNAWGLRIRL
ncbi:MAG: hypothetical protein GY859_08845 [Desulfobacterales bacterium]|nr:hypothetical protein [Desulfobacterales bacterium]